MSPPLWSEVELAQFADCHNAAGIVASWTLQHLSRTPGAKPQPRHARQVWETAKAYWNLANDYLEVEDGKRGYRSKGRKIHLPYEGDIDLSALSTWLRYRQEIEQEEAAVPRLDDVASEGRDPVMSWIAQTGGTRTWFCTPDNVREPIRKMAQSIMAIAPRYLPPGTPTPIGGSLDTIAEYWSEMLALGIYNNFLHTTLAVPFVALIPYSRDVFIRHMTSATGIPVETTDEITTLLTQNRDKVYDPALTPLVQLEDGSIFPMSSLITAGSPHRNILKVLQADTKRYGEVGKLLGKEGEHTVAQLLRRRLGTHCHIDINIPVKHGKQDATDLDVVVYSPRENLLAILEVKWHLQSDGTYEALMHEGEARKKRVKMEKIRAAIRVGTATPQWPSHWNIPDGTEQRWFVITNDVFPTHNLGTSDIKIRPHTLLEHLLPARSSAERLIMLLDDPPTPPVRKHRERHRFGALTVYVDAPDPYGFATEGDIAPNGYGLGAGSPKCGASPV